MSFITIDYNEGDISSYAGVHVTLFRQHKNKREWRTIINSSNPPLDFFRAIILAFRDPATIQYSSMVDHFVRDSNGLYEWATTEYGELFGVLDGVDRFLAFVTCHFDPDGYSSIGGWNEGRRLVQAFFEKAGIDEALPESEMQKHNEDFLHFAKW